MKNNPQNQAIQEHNSPQNSRALFLTQDGYISPMRKQPRQVHPQVTQVQKGQLWQMNRLCDILLEQVSQLKTQQVLSLYRQLNRNFSQNSIEKQGELNKLQKLNNIDIGFLRKKVENEPQIDFNYFNQRIDNYQLEARQINQLVQDYRERVEKIQKQFW